MVSKLAIWGFSESLLQSGYRTNSLSGTQENSCSSYLWSKSGLCLECAFFLFLLFASHGVAFPLFLAQGRSATFAGTAGGRLDTPTALKPTYVSTACSAAAGAEPTCTTSTRLAKALPRPRMAFPSLRNPQRPTLPRPPGLAVCGPTRRARRLSRPAERGRVSSAKPPLRPRPRRHPWQSGGSPRRARSSRTAP